MIRALVAIVFAICASACIALPARANTCTVPNSLVNGQVVDANALNTNFVALQSCGNNIDSTNVGPAGILASQIIANSAAAGTFGGTAVYTFPHGIIANAGISAISLATGSFSGANPVINNSSDGGLNSQVLASSTFGQRWFKYDGTTLTQLGQLDNLGNYSVAGTLSAGGGGLFQTAAPISTIGVGVGQSSVFPTLANSNDGGLNTIVASASTLGSRWFKYNGTTLTQLGALDNTGSYYATNNVTAAGNLYTTNGQVFAGVGNPLLLCANLTCANNFQITAAGYVTASGGEYVSPSGVNLQICANNNCGTAGAVLNTAGQFTAPQLYSTGTGAFGGLFYANAGLNANTGSAIIGIGQGVFSGTVPEINADGSGGMFTSVSGSDALGYRFFSYLGSTATPLLQIQPSGALTINQVGSITRGTSGGTYPYVQGDNVATEKIVRGQVAATTSGVAVTGLLFTSTTTYSCALGAQGTTPEGTSYVVNSATQITVYSNPAAYVSYVCVGG